MSSITNNWAPPVQFHFSVVFKLPSGDTATAKVKEIEDSVYLYNSELHRPSFVGIIIQLNPALGFGVRHLAFDG